MALKTNTAGLYVGPGHLKLGTHMYGSKNYLTPKRKNMLFQHIAMQVLSSARKQAIAGGSGPSAADFAICVKMLKTGRIPLTAGGSASLALRDLVNRSQIVMANDLTATYNDGETAGTTGPVGYFNWATHRAALLAQGGAGTAATLVTDMKAVLATAIA
jgi:hypothetical protein